VTAKIELLRAKQIYLMLYLFKVYIKRKCTLVSIGRQEK